MFEPRRSWGGLITYEDFRVDGKVATALASVVFVVSPACGVLGANLDLTPCTADQI